MSVKNFRMLVNGYVGENDCSDVGEKMYVGEGVCWRRKTQCFPLSGRCMLVKVFHQHTEFLPTCIFHQHISPTLLWSDHLTLEVYSDSLSAAIVPPGGGIKLEFGASE